MAGSTTMPVANPSEKTGSETEQEFAPRYHVIIFDDDSHTYEYVIEMMVVLFGMTPEEGLEIAYEVDNIGQAIVMTVPYEDAEDARKRIVGYGPDFRMPNSTGSMAAMIERAPD